MTNLSITYADVPGFPAGTVLDHIVAQVSGQAEQSVAPGTASVSFDLAAGDYSFSVFGANSGGTALGTPVTGSFTVAAPVTVTLSLPSAVSADVTLSIPSAVTT